MALAFTQPAVASVTTYLVVGDKLTDKKLNFPGVTSSNTLTPTQAKNAINDILGIVGATKATTTKMTRTITEVADNV